MITLADPYDVQLADAKASEADIAGSYGQAAFVALIDTLVQQREAFRMGARMQLELACSDLRNWAVAYAARAAAINAGTEPSDDAKTDSARWATVAGEIAMFARDWLAETVDDVRQSAADT